MYQNIWKKFFDVFFAVIFLVIALLPMTAVAIAIRITTGDSPIFTQIRFGQNGKTFKLYKFRSMSAKAPIVSNQEFDDLESYLTPIGKIIRTTSIDELPQIINILKGEMSFIGPRPLADTDMTVVKLRHEQKSDRVLPGITGYAQVNGRNNVTDIEKATFDFEYAQHISFWFDVRIIFQTLYKVVKQEDVFRE